ncbi:Hypothetical predicted protein, partial [Pelobates cultripes]
RLQQTQQPEKRHYQCLLSAQRKIHMLYNGPSRGTCPHFRVGRQAPSNKHLKLLKQS